MAALDVYMNGYRVPPTSQYSSSCKFRHSYSPLNSSTRGWAQRSVLNDTGAPGSARMRYDGVR